MSTFPVDASIIPGALDSPCHQCGKPLGQHSVFGRGHDFAPMVAPGDPATHESDNRSQQGEDQCRPVEVDGETIRVHGAGQMDNTDREMFAVIVRAAKHLMGLRSCPDCEQGKHAICGGDTWCVEHDDFAPCPCMKRGHKASS